MNVCSLLMKFIYRYQEECEVRIDDKEKSFAQLCIGIKTLKQNNQF